MSCEILFVGLVVAAVFIELTGIYPGGVVVPAFLALYEDQPLRLAATVGVTLLGWLLHRLCSQHFVLFERRRFVFRLLVAGLLAVATHSLLPAFRQGPAELQAMGVNVPGLIANTVERQGVAVTIASAGIATAGSVSPRAGCDSRGPPGPGALDRRRCRGRGRERGRSRRAATGDRRLRRPLDRQAELRGACRPDHAAAQPSGLVVAATHRLAVDRHNLPLAVGSNGLHPVQETLL